MASTNHTTTSVPIFLARFLFPSLLIVVSALLLWIYSENKKNIDTQQALSIALNNRNAVRELDGVQRHLQVPLTEAVSALILASAPSDYLDAADIEAVLQKGNIIQFDFLRFVPASINQEVVANDSPFFEFSQSRQIGGGEVDALLEGWNLINVGLPESPVWIMASAKRVVHGETGLVLGVLVGGVVLNDNQSLVRSIQQSSVNAVFSLFEINGGVIASNFPLAIKARKVLREWDGAVNRVELPTEGGEVQSVLVSRFSYPFVNSHALNIILVYRDNLYQELQGTLFRSGAVALFCTLIIFISFGILARKKMESALGNLLHYTETASIHPTQAVYRKGPFQEFNCIGEAVERTIAMLNKTTEELQDSKERLELAIEGASLGTWDWDIDSGEVIYNRHWAEMLGYQLEEVNTDIHNWENLLHPDEKEEILRKLSDHLDGQSPVYQSEHRLRSKSGDWVWVLESGRVYKYDKMGNPQRAVGIHLDISRRKGAEQALVGERALLVSLINSIPDLIFHKNDKGLYLGCNKAFEKICGKREREIIGKTDRDLFPSGAPSFLGIPEGVMSEEGQSRRNDEWVIYPDGSRVLLDTLIIPFVGADNEPLGLLGVSRDVTHKKKMEAELLKIEKLESVGVLAGGIAHDFNNILTAVLGNIELANYRFGKNDKEASALLKEAIKATRRAVKLTRQLLTFAKGEELIKDATDLKVLIEEISQFVLHGSRVGCRYDFPEKLWMVDADCGQISQVIQNIIMNAKYAMEDGGTVSIRCKNIVQNHEGLQGGEFVQIVISDTGSGIPKEYLDKIFDPYFTTKQKGNGLGLAISYSIVIKHRGRMTVSSQLGQGTAFTILLPAREVHRGRIVEDLETKIEEFPAAKILLMDDEEEVREVAGSQLTTLGLAVETVRDGGAAVAAYREAWEHGEPYDIVIVDLTVPAGMGGRKTAKRILEIDATAKVVLMSGYVNNSVMVHFQDYGFQATVTKPFGLLELGQMLRKVLG